MRFIISSFTFAMVAALAIAGCQQKETGFQGDNPSEQESAKAEGNASAAESAPDDELKSNFGEGAGAGEEPNPPVVPAANECSFSNQDLLNQLDPEISSCIKASRIFEFDSRTCYGDAENTKWFDCESLANLRRIFKEDYRIDVDNSNLRDAFAEAESGEVILVGCVEKVSKDKKYKAMITQWWHTGSDGCNATANLDIDTLCGRFYYNAKDLPPPARTVEENKARVIECLNQ